MDKTQVEQLRQQLERLLNPAGFFDEKAELLSNFAQLASEHERLQLEVRRLRAALHKQTDSMSSRLRDALRE